MLPLKGRVKLICVIYTYCFNAVFFNDVQILISSQYIFLLYLSTYAMFWKQNSCGFGKCINKCPWLARKADEEILRQRAEQQQQRIVQIWRKDIRNTHMCCHENLESLTVTGKKSRGGKKNVCGAGKERQLIQLEAVLHRVEKCDRKQLSAQHLMKWCCKWKLMRQ